EKNMKPRTWMLMAAASLLLLFIGLAIPAQARIVYTPLEVGLPIPPFGRSGSDYYAIDINHDGITDFTFQSTAGFLPCFPVGGGPYQKLTVQPNPGGGIVASGSNAAALPSGVQIDSSQSFDGGKALMFFSGTRCFHSAGQWV